MSAFLYVLSLKTLELMARVAALFKPKAKQFILGRNRAWQELEEQITNNSAPLLWVHAASVGEYEQGRPLIEAFKKHYEEYRVLVTFFSPSGYNAVTTDDLINFKAYLPFDGAANARRFLKVVNPKMAMFIKYEFWHFYLKELQQQNIPIFSISAIFRPDQAFFKWYGGFFRNMLKRFTYFFVQDKESFRLLQEQGLPCSITGDTRLDRVIDIKEKNAGIVEVDNFLKGEKAFVIGSLRKEDIDVVIPFMERHPELKFIIAPHEIIPEMMAPLETKFDCIRFSQLNQEKANFQVLIIDNIGMLSRLYRYASYAYVGGGFSDGLHNILEPAVYEIPIFFGNKDYQRFKEANDLLALGAAYAIGNSIEFEEEFIRISSEESRLAAIREILNDYLDMNKGAADKIIDHLSKLVE